MNPLLYEDLIRLSLREDLGRGGDLTSEAVIPTGTTAQALIVAREKGCIAGLPIAAATFKAVDSSLIVEMKAKDGDLVPPGAPLARVSGPAPSLLTAERTALNFLGHLSGIATATRQVVDAIADSRARVACTRKTTPMLRALEKYAVRCGGGINHRFGLDDAVMIKDNHRATAGSLEAAVGRARARIGHTVKIEVEVDTLDQLDQALALEVDIVLLDNMSPETLTEAVRRVRAAGVRTVTEASGNITPQTAAAVAATGVDVLSLGWITHSAPRLDVALDVVLDAPR